MAQSFFAQNWKVIVIGLVGVLLGVFLNYYFGRKRNRDLLFTLESELKKLQSKSNITSDEEKQIQYLQGEIYILKFKCR